MTETVVLVEREPPIAVVLLNRPKQLNALSDELMDELVRALTELDEDIEIRCIVLGGSERAFAAGADIGVLAQTSPYEAATSAASRALGLDPQGRDADRGGGVGLLPRRWVRAGDALRHRSSRPRARSSASRRSTSA